MVEPTSTSAHSIEVRSLTAEDAEAFHRFLADVPPGERRFLKEGLSDPVVAFDLFLADRGARRIAAVAEGGVIAGLAGAFPGEGWSSHVAEVRVLVASASRGSGVGRELARAVLLEALAVGCHQVFVEVVAEQEALVGMFQDLGFAPEALLADFVRDSDGSFHDLMMLTHRVADNRGRQHVMGLAGVSA